jgi:hypothetical protein
MYRLHWQDATGKKRVKYFTTLRQMRAYAKKECREFLHKLRYSILNGSRYEPFEVIGGKVYTLSMLISIVVKLKEEREGNEGRV